MAETIFKMLGAREILELSVGGVSSARHIQALEDAVESNPSLVFDLSRSLVESVCKTILIDCGTDPEKLGFKDLLRRTYQVVRLVPDGYSTKREIIESIQRIMDGFESVIQGLTDLRHNEGIASHGKDLYSIQLESVQARLAAQSADVIVRYLYMAHKSYQLPANVSATTQPKMQYDDNNEFNSYIDENNDEVKIFELTYPASEALFYTDEEAYRDLLSQYSSSKDE